MTFDPAAAAAELLRAAGIAAQIAETGGPGPAAEADGEAILGGVSLRVVGVGWATVELDRAATELASSGPWRIEPAQPDTLLGATARIARPVDGRPVAVLLEPSTEGRLAAFLARHGEAPAVLYLGPPDGGLASVVGRLAAAGVRTRSGEGPLGPAALVLGRSLFEPLVVVVGVPSAA